MTEFQCELDARGENCPNPVVMTRKTLKTMSFGQVLHVIATDPVSVEDIGMLLDVIRYPLVDSQESNGEFHFFIKKAQLCND